MERTPVAAQHLNHLKNMFSNPEPADPWPEIWKILSDQQRRAVVEYSKLTYEPRDVPDYWHEFRNAEKQRVKDTIWQFASLSAKLVAAERKLIRSKAA